MKNDLFEWTDEYSVGITEIDRQHQRLFDIINELHNAFKAGKADLLISETLDKLLLYTKYHFKTEEFLMKEYDFPNIEKHQKMHREFEKIVTDKINEMKRGSKKVPYETMTFLRDWLSGHILGTDKAYFKNLDLD
jgi:hemerythrin-like metal-binding protein